MTSQNMRPQDINSRATRPSYNGRNNYQKVLNPFYYLEHFNQIASTVASTYDRSFDTELTDFLEAYYLLDRDQKALVVRAGCRKKKLFDFESLCKYQEIEDPGGQIERLKKGGWFQEPATLYDLHLQLEESTVARLKTMIRDAGHTPGSLTKRGELLKKAYQTVGRDHLKSPLMGLRHRRAIDKMMYLYFGSGKEGLTTLALKDLGYRRTNDFQQSQRPRFSNSKLFQSEFFYSNLWKDLKSKSELWWRHELGVPGSVGQWPARHSRKSSILYNNILAELAKGSAFTETEAVDLLGAGDSYPARVKHARALFKLKRDDEAKRKLELILADPATAEEAIEAEDLLALKTGIKKKTAVTRELRASNIVQVDDAYRGQVELGVKLLLEQGGTEVIKSENRLWGMLFGLLFWDVLYGHRSQGIHSHFDSLPSSLLQGTFKEQFSDIISTRLKGLFSKEIKKQLLRSSTENYGKRNGIFRWSKNGLVNLEKVLATEDPRIIELMLDLSANFLERRSGFPDLVRIRGGVLDFIEVKGEGDLIRRNQMAKIKTLRALGFEVEVLRAEYAVNPKQTYVVVDVETTGGKASHSRVTEIGAVKLIGDTVVDEFQSLLNPGRPIPRGIVKLTGITDAMVSTAPLFADVAHDFAAFCGDAVFVAHHVRFDYSFIREEFSRVGERFKMPQLCTCALSRKHFKGLTSYGLANLSRHFDIELTNHHRALADARAAAEILRRLNRVR